MAGGNNRQKKWLSQALNLFRKQMKHPPATKGVRRHAGPTQADAQFVHHHRPGLVRIVETTVAACAATLGFVAQSLGIMGADATAPTNPSAPENSRTSTLT
jgi:hypothetical protein